MKFLDPRGGGRNLFWGYVLGSSWSHVDLLWLEDSQALTLGTSE